MCAHMRAGDGAAGAQPVGRVERARQRRHAAALRRLRSGGGAAHPGGPAREGVRAPSAVARQTAPLLQHARVSAGAARFLPAPEDGVGNCTLLWSMRGAAVVRRAAARKVPHLSRHVVYASAGAKTPMRPALHELFCDACNREVERVRAIYKLFHLFLALMTCLRCAKRARVLSRAGEKPSPVQGGGQGVCEAGRSLCAPPGMCTAT